MSLTNVKIDNAKPTEKPQKLRDGNGLYIFIPKKIDDHASNDHKRKPYVTKSWRFDFRFGGKRYTLAFGLYPTVGLAQARNFLTRRGRSNMPDQSCTRQVVLDWFCP